MQHWCIQQKTQKVTKNAIFPFSYFNGTVLNRKQICNAELHSAKKQTVVVKESDERRLGFHMAKSCQDYLDLGKTWTNQKLCQLISVIAGM